MTSSVRTGSALLTLLVGSTFLIALPGCAETTESSSGSDAAAQSVSKYEAAIASNKAATPTKKPAKAKEARPKPETP